MMDDLNLLLQDIKNNITWVAGLACDIGAMIHQPIYYDDLCEVNGYKLYLARSGKVLAYVYPTIEGFRIVSSEEWATKASLTTLVDKVDKSGWWGKPAVYWHVTWDDSAGYRRLVMHLSRIAEVRHV